jgi:hypothetical protein
MAEVAEKETAEEQRKGKFIGGKILIVADSETGGIHVDAPANLLVAMGMLEIAKCVLVQRQQGEMKDEPTIKVATPGDLKALADKTQH